MKPKLPVLTWAALFLVATLPISSPAQARMDLPIEKGWRFARENPLGAQRPEFNASAWETVAIPHTWNSKDGQDGGNDYYRGIGWYRTDLKLDKTLRGKKLYLKFDGVSSAAEVFVNGLPVGKHKGSFGAFCFDITSFVKPGSGNTLAVKVSNAKDSTISPLRGDFTMYGGIYRRVHLLVLDQVSVSPLDDASSGVYVKQTSVSAERALLDVAVQLLNGTENPAQVIVRCALMDAKGKKVAATGAAVTLPSNGSGKADCKLTIPQPHLWNGLPDPYMYQVAVEVTQGGRTTDRVVQSVGLRSFSVDPDKGFFLNGKPYRLHGVNRHQDRQNMGWAITAREHGEDFRMIEEIGANAIRLAHYQHAQEFYDLCDKGGMVVWAELALVDDIHPNQEFAAVCQQQLRELIKQNFNHPSICFWSLENELIPDSNPELYSKFVRDLNALAKQLDPTRLTTVASRSKYDGNDGMNAVTDVIGYNVYRGWYDGKAENFGSYADKLHERFPLRAMAISEYGAGASINQHEYPPKKPNTKGPWHPEEWQSLVHEITWKAMAQRPYLWGTFVWNMFDFGSDGRAEGEHSGQNDKGLVSFDRKIKKDAFFWYKANWNAEPMVHIAGKRFSPRPPGPIEIKVYSNCESVELFLNGKSLGAKKSDDMIYTWSESELREGENLLVAVGNNKGMRLKDECRIIASTNPKTALD